MDRDFHIDDFERLLKEKADEFRMYPSKRIWHSIYNNIHPGRKWPSVVMSITLVTSLFLVGYLNTRNASMNSVSRNIVIQQEFISQAKSPLLFSQSLPHFISDISNNTAFIPENDKAGVASNSNLDISKPYTKVADKPSSLANLTITAPQSNPGNSTINSGSAIINDQSGIGTATYLTNEINTVPAVSEREIEESTNNFTISTESLQPEGLQYSQKTDNGFIIKNLAKSEFSNSNVKKLSSGIIRDGISSVEKNDLAINPKNTISAEDRDWIDNYALYNRPVTRKWANRLSHQTYITPSVVYRTLNNYTDVSNTITATPFASSTSMQNVSNTLHQKPSLGIEIGTGIQYSILKGLQLKTGLQLNFTQYNSEAFQNSHPVATMLTMHDIKTNSFYQVYRSTPYSTKSGLESIKLHNQTFQISIPMGADLKLAGNENLQWNIGATIQPTYVVGGKSYLISSDRNNYVKETSFLNKWNLNAGFETFITFKSKGLNWQVGPQFRTQLFSTNSNILAVEEKLVNYGLKFGVSKTLR